MSHHASVTVPAEQADLVLEALLCVYAARAYALAERAERTDPGRLQEARAELTDADRALDAFGWQPGARLVRAELAGSGKLVGAVLACALGDTRETFGGVLDDYGRGEATLAELERAHARMSAMLGLFASYEREQAV